MNQTPLIYRTARPEYLTISAFATHFAISKMTAYRLVNEGVVRGLRIGRSVRIPVGEVARYTEAAAINPLDDLPNEP